MTLKEELSDLGVIKFKPRENSEVLREREKPYTECQHYSFLLDTEDRSVNCEQCSKPVDAFFAMTRLIDLFRDQDYKYDKIVEFEAQEKLKRERDKERRERKAQRYKTLEGN